MSNKVKKIDVLKELFLEENVQYVIPLYQRAFAWERKEIFQLIEDINDIKDDTKNYFLGTLVVARTNDCFEIIDGQQRLTTLYLLFNTLGIHTKKCLSYYCREKSNYTLINLRDKNFDKEKCEVSLLKGIKEIEDAIRIKEREDKEFRNKFKEKLDKVKLYRIEVPDNTDLNRYFEIMNTRGEQLEQTDILKANLMSYFTKYENKKVKNEVFAKVWDACSDMNVYVQMNFNSTDRDILFTNSWDAMPLINELLNKEYKNANEKNGNNKSITIERIDNIKEEDLDKEYGIDDKDCKRRFKSIVNFPYFLLHALRIFVKQNRIVSKIEGKKLFDELLDDKELVHDFKNVVDNGLWDGENINKEKFSMEFIIFLLNLRFLFDKYIIKREFADDDKNGKWSLKELKVSTASKSRSAYFVNTTFEKDKDYSNRMNLMLQSCLRVSYTSPKVMHWITELLNWLYENANQDNLINSINKYLEFTEAIARKACRNFLDVGDYNMGVNTPHIVFNYLDYLLWKKVDGKIDFIFEFRDSVEHWYPQNPSKGTFDKWTHEEGLDNFGNLCLIQREINSEFSNLAPSGKKSTFIENISKGSLKLREMNKLTVGTNEESANKYWKEKAYKIHGDEMIRLLKENCLD